MAVWFFVFVLGIRDELAQMRAPTLEGKTLSDYFIWLFRNRDFTFKVFMK